ncbi:IS5 family transposase [Saccharopolyspora erythraea]|nr:IS5 family transposase [Saccharopolyspora erythraea]QRK93508.1 IS5 family transposase [Saccharopolyspora erythraea]
MEKWCPEPLWLLARSLLPEAPQRHQGGGRRRLDDRAVLAAILYVLQTGCAWSALPTSFGVSCATAHRRFTEWSQADVFTRLHQELLDLLGTAGAIDWSRASVDSMHIRAVKRGTLTGPSPVDRGKPGSKIHAMSDRSGIPLAVVISAANRNDHRELQTVIDAVAPVRGSAGRPRRRPRKLHADKGYDYPVCRHALRRRGIIARIARRGIESTTRLGRHRYVIERTLEWVSRFRRLARRYERKAAHYAAFASLACAVICYRRAAKLDLLTHNNPK